MLKRGGEVWVFAPSNGYDEYKGKVKILDRACQEFAEMGLKLVFPDGLSSKMDSLKQTSVASRVDLIHSAFAARRCKGIISIAGGTGCSAIISKLDWGFIRNHPKEVMGYSDVTDFLLAYSYFTGLPSQYAPGAFLFGTNYGVYETAQSFARCVMTREPYVVTDFPYYVDAGFEKLAEDIVPYANPGSWVIQEGYAAGRTFTGNIATMARSTGFDWFPRPDDSVLILESSAARKADGLSEDILRIVDSARDPRTIRGICLGIFGSATGFERQKLRDTIANAVSNYGLRSDIPVVANIGTGHIMPRHTIPNFGTCMLSTESGRCRLTILDRSS